MYTDTLINVVFLYYY